MGIYHSNVRGLDIYHRNGWVHFNITQTSQISPIYYSITTRRVSQMATHFSPSPGTTLPLATSSFVLLYLQCHHPSSLCPNPPAPPTAHPSSCQSCSYRTAHCRDPPCPSSRGEVVPLPLRPPTASWYLLLNNGCSGCYCNREIYVRSCG